MELVYNWLQRSWDRLFPLRCAVCQAIRISRSGLCPACHADLVPVSLPCMSCGAAMAIATLSPCGACLKRAPSFDRVVAPWQYRFPLDRIIQRYKFNGCLYLAPVLGDIWSSGAAQFEKPQALVPIPLHPRRIRQRGFNQAFEIANHMGRKFDIPLASKILRRVRATSSQTGLNADRRRANLARAFTVLGTRLPTHLALVDDVMTTGSTAHACALVLKRAGVARVDIWAIARA